MAGFSKKGSLNGGVDQGKLINDIIANSETIQVGDAVKYDTDGFLVVATAGSKVLGIVTQVTDKNGIRIDPDSSTLDTYTVASDNETVAQKKAYVEVDKDALFKNDSSGSLTRTNVGQFFDLTDENTINQGSASDTAGQFQLIKLDPDNESDASQGLFKIAESQLDPYAQQ